MGPQIGGLHGRRFYEQSSALTCCLFFPLPHLISAAFPQLPLKILGNLILTIWRMPLVMPSEIDLWAYLEALCRRTVMST